MGRVQALLQEEHASSRLPPLPPFSSRAMPNLDTGSLAEFSAIVSRADGSGPVVKNRASTRCQL
uniref:Uncharacterized protein n=1 Tax=Physcomitrium patens TaxID=3218 RepID=A0A2K1IN37_PHYPA|nr:hypothetical protein PHYPA_027007 [Physcomitrium patens]